MERRYEASRCVCQSWFSLPIQMISLYDTGTWWNMVDGNRRNHGRAPKHTTPVFKRIDFSTLAVVMALLPMKEPTCQWTWRSVCEGQVEWLRTFSCMIRLAEHSWANLATHTHTHAFVFITEPNSGRICYRFHIVIRSGSIRNSVDRASSHMWGFGTKLKIWIPKPQAPGQFGNASNVVEVIGRTCKLWLLKTMHSLSISR